VALIVATYEVIWTYSSYTVLDTRQKRLFNFFVTALSMALGMNIAGSLKSVATQCRWWILSWEKRPLQEVGYTFHESIHLLTESRPKLY
jgi:hypothetical protein